MSGHALWLSAIAVLVLAIGVLVAGTLLVFRKESPK